MPKTPHNLRNLYSPEEARIYDRLGIKDTTYEIGFCAVGQMLGDLRGQTLLDFGSGAGRSAAFLISLGASKVFGVDRDLNMLLRARERNMTELQLFKIAETIPLVDASVDGAVSLNVFIEIPSRDMLHHVCREIARVVKPSGTVVIMSTNPDAFFCTFRNFRYLTMGKLKSGARVTCTINNGIESFQVQDTFWTEKDYLCVVQRSGLLIQKVLYPTPMHPYDWTTDECAIPPFIVIRALKTSFK